MHLEPEQLIIVVTSNITRQAFYGQSTTKAKRAIIPELVVLSGFDVAIYYN